MGHLQSKVADRTCECGCGKATNLAPQGHTRNGWVKGQPVRWRTGHCRRRHDPTRLENSCERSESGCLIWTGAKASRNPARAYPRIRLNGKNLTVTRLVLEATIRRALRPGEFALHHCDTPSCVEVTHLFVGTHADNMRDRDAKGRQTPFRGEDCGNAKLTEVEVREIRRLLGIISHKGIGERFGVSKRTIGRIANRETWVHVS